MNVNLNEIILGNYGGVRVDAKVDEKMEDVKLIIEYDDHGDEFLIVKTKDNNIYEYGWYLNRICTMDYDDVINSESDCGFIRKPKLFYKDDKHCEFSNKIYWEFDRRFENSFKYVKGYKQHSMEDAQYRFDKFIEYMHREVEPVGIIYDLSRYGYEQDLKHYLDKHDILTEENIVKIENVKWSSKINGIDGFAGKKSLSIDDRIYGDDIQYIYYNGKFRDIEKVKKKHSYDDWGFKRFDLSLKQFR